MNILLTGGGTGGPVAPLLAVAQVIKKNHPRATILFVGTKRGPEKRMAEAAGLPFVHILSAKMRRYFSLKNLFAPFVLLAAFFQSLYVLRSRRIDCIFGAGGYVQVPLVWAGWFLRIPSVIHQQDVLPSLANLLCQFPAKKITVTFEETSKRFVSGLGMFNKAANFDKVEVTGNPVRADLALPAKAEALKFFGLSEDLPVLYVSGGGTGSYFINRLIGQALPRLKKVVQIIHSTGPASRTWPGSENHHNYHAFEFVDRADMAYAAADLVLARAGLSTITELSYLKKTAIVVPLPQTHQEINAELLDRKQAALVLPQEHLSADALIFVVRKLLFKFEMQKTMQKNIYALMPHDASERVADIIIRLATKRHGIQAR